MVVLVVLELSDALKADGPTVRDDANVGRAGPSDFDFDLGKLDLPRREDH